jgi:hypothetical protein
MQLQTEAASARERHNAEPTFEHTTLYELAREYLEAASGSTEDARAMLIERLETDHRVLAAIADAAISEAVRSVVGSSMRTDRAAIIKGVATKPKLDFNAVTKSLEDTHRRMLLDFPLAGGVRLRDATREEVLAQADLYRKTETDARRKSTWLESVAKRLKPRQVVGKVMSEDKVVTLFVEAGNV